MDPCSFALNCSTDSAYEWLRKEILKRRPEYISFMYYGTPVHVDYEMPWRQRQPSPIGGYGLYLDSWLRLMNDFGLERHPHTLEVTILPSGNGGSAVEVACNYDLAAPFFKDLLIDIARARPEESALSIATYLRDHKAQLPHDLRLLLEADVGSQPPSQVTSARTTSAPPSSVRGSRLENRVDWDGKREKAEKYLECVRSGNYSREGAALRVGVPRRTIERWVRRLREAAPD